MTQIVYEILSYPFMVRAIIVGVLLAICSSFLGVSLVLKRYSMIGDGLSHVGFGSLAVATTLNWAPMSVAIPVVILAAFLLLRLSENSKIKGDAAIAMISVISLASGVMIISLTTGINTDVCNYMFGSILGMTKNDMNITIFFSILIMIVYVLFYNRIFAVTFDENFTKATGNNAKAYNSLIAIMTAMVIVLGMRMMGAMLVSSLIVMPTLTAMRICKSFRSVILNAVCISILCLLSGIYVSYVFATPTGASIVMCNFFMFLVYFSIGKLRALR